MDTNAKSASGETGRRFVVSTGGNGSRGLRSDPRRWLSQSGSNRARANANAKRWSGAAISLLVVLASFITPIAGAPAPAHATTGCTPAPTAFTGNGTIGENGVPYIVLTFTAIGDCNWTVPANITEVDVLVVGGGGGGGGTGGRTNWSAGGGAGGDVFEKLNHSVTPATTIEISVGDGGPGGSDTCRPNLGACGALGGLPGPGDPSHFGPTSNRISTLGGGRGGHATVDGAPDGPKDTALYYLDDLSVPTRGGGGGAQTYAYRGADISGSSLAREGGDGYGASGLTSAGLQAAGGGAGAGGRGDDAIAGIGGDGGPGVSSAITGTSLFYGGGGGGGKNGSTQNLSSGGVAGSGGSGVGGYGGKNAAGFDGPDNRGGGGGGAGTEAANFQGGNGGSGVVIVRYTENVALTTTFGAPTRTADGFTVQITNYDANFTWAGTATANGSVAISGSGLVTVTGVAAGAASALTVTTNRTHFPGGSASVTASALEAAPPPNNNSSGSSGSSGNTSPPSVAPVVSPPVAPATVTPRGVRRLSPPSTAPVTPSPALGGQYDLDAGPRALVGGQLAPLATTRSPNGGIALATPRLQFEMTPSGTSQTSSSPAPSVPTDVTLSRGQSAMVSGGGFAPRSSVRLSLDGVAGQGLRELAQISVNAEGKFDTDLQFDARGTESPVAIGRHGLQVVGVDSEGNETLLNLTIAISQGDPQPEPNLTRGDLPALSLGQSLATSAGIPETVRIEAISEAREVSVISGTWRFRINLDNAGGSVERSGQGATMILAPSQTTTVSGEGFQPDTRVDVWLFSEPSLLGSVAVSGDGTFSGEFSINPGFVAPGAHTLQLQGVGTDGFIKAANLGVLVQDSQASESAKPLSLLVWTIVALVIAAAIVVVALVIRNRRNK